MLVIGAYLLAISLTEKTVIALIGFAGVVVTGLFGLLSSRANAREASRAKREMRLQSQAMSFDEFLSEWGEVTHDLYAIMKTTRIDRFVLLRAWNGSSDPRWTTAIYQFRQGAQPPISYVHLDLDADYVTRLRQTVEHGSVAVSTDSLPESLIRGIYRSEGVRHAAWFFIRKRSLDQDERFKAITYCSFATSDEEPLSEEDIAKCRLLVARIRNATEATQKSE